jgi:hypothetical protein
MIVPAYLAVSSPGRVGTDPSPVEMQSGIGYPQDDEPIEKSQVPMA